MKPCRCQHCRCSSARVGATASTAASGQSSSIDYERAANIFARGGKYGSNEEEQKRDDAKFLTSSAAQAIGGPEAGAAMGKLVDFTLEIGDAFDWLAYKLGIHAGAGAGRCADPPSDPSDSSWVHFGSRTFGTIDPPRNDFERALRPVLEQVWELQANCRPINGDDITRELVRIWNETHDESVQVPYAPWGFGDYIYLPFGVDGVVNLGALRVPRAVSRDVLSRNVLAQALAPPRLVLKPGVVRVVAQAMQGDTISKNAVRTIALAATNGDLDAQRLAAELAQAHSAIEVLRAWVDFYTPEGA